MERWEDGVEEPSRDMEEDTEVGGGKQRAVTAVRKEENMEELREVTGMTGPCRLGWTCSQSGFRGVEAGKMGKGWVMADAFTKGVHEGKGG